MGLLNPSPGEMIDRMTILELKTRACPDVEYLAAELDELKRILGRKRTVAGELRRINAALWHLEDRIRAGDTTVAKRICELNDERRRQVRAVDELFGWEEHEPKIYADEIT